MYSFYTQTEAGFNSMHFNRERVRSGIALPQELGHTVVTLARKERPSGIIIPTDLQTRLLGGGGGDSLELRQAAALAEAERVETLDELVERAKACWHDLLQGEVVEGSETHLAELTREQDVTASGLVVVEEPKLPLGDVFHYPWPEQEFDGYVATAAEIDAIERIRVAALAYEAQHDPSGPPTGNYL